MNRTGFGRHFSGGIIGAGLFVRSLDRVRSQDLGFSTEKLLFATLDFRSRLPGPVEDEAHVAAVERLRQLGGVAGATVVQALPKGDRGELAVETMTETGVDAVVPWAASRCITQWKGERGQKALGKWRATAREAGKQSRRVRFPEVAELATTKQVVALLADADLAAVLHEEGSEPLATAALPTTGHIVLVVGPEGGVSPDELAAFAQAGAKPCRLGRSVLRTSTAGTAATALLLGRTGRWS